MKVILLLIVFLSGCVATPQKTEAKVEPAMQLGNFSVSLAVKDIAVSRAFYEKLGFTVRGGDQAQNWLVLQNESTIIGLFQDMFEQNILTFNPGWDNDGKQLPEYKDVRELQKIIKAKGIKLLTEADESTSGPAYFMLEDPDGNQILIDQHVPALD
ncbi:VOC family protein [Aliiglaciecola sp. NS0011-25]|uniref:VOC family protein n=1 Tax=Aliiglaciecola sp. NS0011-25 TaxID=3127654 RepID=UPI00310857E3